MNKFGSFQPRALQLGEQNMGTQPDDQLAQWASLFLAKYSDEAGVDQPALPAAGIQYNGITQSARELLWSVDAGGVPAFVTNNLKQIAVENGIEVTDQSTPNEIIEGIRSKTLGGVSADSKTPG